MSRSAPLIQGGDGLLRRQQSLALGHGQVERVSGVTAKDSGLQNTAVLQRRLKGGEIRRPDGAQALRQVDAVIWHTIIPSAARGGVDLAGILSERYEVPPRKLTGGRKNGTAPA